MKEMSSYITIGNYIFRHNAGVQILSSWKEMTDTAEVQLPNYYGKLETKITTGMPILINLGYDGNMYTEFTGYIAERKASSPLTFLCEDEMWKLKQKEVTMAWKQTTLKDVIKYLVPDAVITYVPDIELKPFRIDRSTVARAFQELKKNYNLVVYFRGKQLHVGAPYQERIGNVKYRFSDQQANANFGDLQYKRKDDVRIKLTAISMQPDNTKIELSLGDVDGEQRTLHFYNLTEAELRQQGEEHIELLKYNGFRGTFQAFGIPRARHSQIAEIQDANYPERSGSYFIDEVETRYNGDDGFKRFVTLGKAV